MALQDPIHHRSKTLAEGAVCFSCALIALAAAAVVLQRVIGLLPSVLP